jgi:glycosyltransferase involved in cell wall biosynthesis
MSSKATIVIAARNARTTIGRALASVRDQGDYPIVLVDDFSTDETVSRALQNDRGRVRVVSPPSHETLGLARQVGLMAVETPIGIWLDADDALLPGRIERMIGALEDGMTDFVCDEVELMDGPTGEFRKILPIPDFLKGRHPLARLFERNYLPGVGVFGFRVESARRIGYDTRLHGAEDSDFILRAVAAEAGIHLLDMAGYRQYGYPQSLSRRLENQRGMYRAALKKHSYSKVRALYLKAGHDTRVANWGLASMALFRKEYARALQFVAQADSGMADPTEVLEPEGPCPMPEGWRVSFHRGTTLLLMGRYRDALRLLEAAEQFLPSAAGANNLGVAMSRNGERELAISLFEQSLERFPGFLDAQLNLQSSEPDRITTHPLRVEASRSNYSRAGLARGQSTPAKEIVIGNNGGSFIAPRRKPVSEDLNGLQSMGGEQ